MDWEFGLASAATVAWRPHRPHWDLSISNGKVSVFNSKVWHGQGHKLGHSVFRRFIFFAERRLPLFFQIKRKCSVLRLWLVRVPRMDVFPCVSQPKTIYIRKLFYFFIIREWRAHTGNRRPNTIFLVDVVVQHNRPPLTMQLVRIPFSFFVSLFNVFSCYVFCDKQLVVRRGTWHIVNNSNSMNHFGSLEGNAPPSRRQAETDRVYPNWRNHVWFGECARLVACHWFRRIRYKSISNRISSDERPNHICAPSRRIVLFLFLSVNWMDQSDQMKHINLQRQTLGVNERSVIRICVVFNRKKGKNEENSMNTEYGLRTDVNSLFASCASSFVTSLFVVMYECSHLFRALVSHEGRDRERQGESKSKWNRTDVNGYSIHSKSIRLIPLLLPPLMFTFTRNRDVASIDTTSICFVIQTHPSWRRYGTDSHTCIGRQPKNHWTKCVRRVRNRIVIHFSSENGCRSCTSSSSNDTICIECHVAHWQRRVGIFMVDGAQKHATGMTSAKCREEENQ